MTDASHDGSPGPILAAEGLTRVFSARSGGQIFRRGPDVRAVDDVSFALMAGETLAVVGESGCGKSTLGGCCCGCSIRRRDASSVSGQDYSAATGRRAARSPPARADGVSGPVQLAQSAPHRRARSSPSRSQAYGIVRAAAERRDRVAELLRRVGLRPEHARRYPAEFSGGQRQRIGIARAIAVEPAVIVADEPVSALDVSVQAQIINLFQDLQAQARPRLSVHRARSRGRAAHRRPGRGDVSRPHRRDRPEAASLRRAATPLYARAALGRAAPRTRRAPGSRGARRRPAEPDRNRRRLRLRHALPDRHATVAGPNGPSCAKSPMGSAPHATSQRRCRWRRRADTETREEHPHGPDRTFHLA